MDAQSTATSKTTTKDVLILELNEFNTDLLQIAAKNHHLPNISKLLETKRVQYKTLDRYNSGYLEPWVQWVSIHTGTSSQHHRIKHLGDVPDLKYAQTWEVLSDHNITTGIWGVMNGKRHNKENVQFFLPDPWTFDEPAYPAKLNHLLDLPRYLAKNYRNLKIVKIIAKALGLLKFIASSGVGLKILKECISLLGAMAKRGAKHYVFIAKFDYVSTLLFMQYKRQFKPKCSILFLNSLAHIQHHHWKQGPEGITGEILFGLQNIDRILGLLKNTFPDNALVVHNGLSQMNTNHEKAWVLYRQKDPLQFLKTMKLNPIRVEQHMTHDGHAFFKTKEACLHAHAFLSALKIQNKHLFHVELNQHDETKLFYQLSFTDALKDKKAVFTHNDQTFLFYRYFDAIVTRTGRHIPIGTVFSDEINFSDHMFNHEFHNYVHHYLLPEQFPLKSKNLNVAYREPDISEAPVIAENTQPEAESISS